MYGWPHKCVILTVYHLHIMKQKSRKYSLLLHEDGYTHWFESHLTLHLKVRVSLKFLTDLLTCSYVTDHWTKKEGWTKNQMRNKKPVTKKEKPFATATKYLNIYASVSLVSGIDLRLLGTKSFRKLTKRCIETPDNSLKTNLYKTTMQMESNNYQRF